MAKQSVQVVEVGQVVQDAGKHPLLDIVILPILSTSTDLIHAQETFASTRKQRKEIEAVFDGIIKPHKEAIAINNKQKKHIVDRYKENESLLEISILNYRARLKKEAEKEQERELKKWDKRVDKAEEKGKDITEVVPAVIVNGPEKTVQVEDGSMTGVKVTTWEIPGVGGSDKAKELKITRDNSKFKDIDDSFFILDVAAVTKQVKAGAKPRGIRVYEKETLAVR